MSSSATSSSITSSPSSSTSSTITWSGAFTSALATCSINAFGLAVCSVMFSFKLLQNRHGCTGINTDTSRSSLDPWKSVLVRGDLKLRRYRLNRCSRRKAQNLAHAAGHLGSLGAPVVNALALELHASRGGAGIVRPHNLHRTPIARPFLLNHHHAVVRLFARTYAR